ncbi:MAG: amidohydrolase [Bacillota bacterium]|nr:amidohydrolase [Bacillota bacterium]
MKTLILGNVYTMDHDHPRAEAIGIEGGKILFVGDREETDTAGYDQVVDYGEKTIFPGFIDTHTHVIPAGIFMSGVELSDCKDLPSVFEKMKVHAAGVKKGKWVIASGFQDKNMAERRFPTRQELDLVSEDHPVILCHNDLHPIGFNTRAMKIIKPDPSKAGVITDAKGTLTGVIEDPACIDMLADVLGKIGIGNIISGCKLVDEYAVSKGVTTVFGKDVMVILQLRELCKSLFKAEFVPMWYSDGCKDLTGIRKILKSKNFNRRTCICAFADGSFDAHSAAVHEPYEDMPDSRGQLLNTDQEMYDFTMEAHKNGLQVSFHAIGDGAIDQVLRVYERVLQDHPKEDHRLRIEHFEMPTEEAIKKAAELGVALGMQPLLIEVCEGMDFSGYECFVGERVARCSPYRSILDKGILVGGGTDYPVTPMEIFHGARILMEHPVEGERITLMEALEMNTCEAAKLGFLENRKGKVCVGMDADLTVVDMDPFAIETAHLDDIRVLHTYCRGREVYSASQPIDPWTKMSLLRIGLKLIGKKLRRNRK